MSASPPNLEAIRDDYRALWGRMDIDPARQGGVNAAAHRILAGAERYKTVADKVGLPAGSGWAYVGLIHYRESNCNFHCHLHNGDPLNARTVHVPVGRPETGTAPFTWEESALDALNLDAPSDLGTVEGLACSAELYNGEGYRNHGHPDPYTLAGSNLYSAGKYDRDGHYNASLVDPQEGVLPVLKSLMAIDPSIVFGEPKGAPTVSPPTSPAAPQGPTSESPTGSWVHTLALLFSTLTGAFASLGQAFDAIRPLLSDPMVVGALLAALAAAGIVIWREHHRAVVAP